MEPIKKAPDIQSGALTEARVQSVEIKDMDFIISQSDLHVQQIQNYLEVAKNMIFYLFATSDHAWFNSAKDFIVNCFFDFLY